MPDQWDQFPNAYETRLPPAKEARFQAWKRQYAPQDSGEDYDLRGAFSAGLKPGANGHWPDTFKKPNHPTFSNQSVYAADAPDKAGSWNGETYIPPAAASDPWAQFPDAQSQSAPAPTAAQQFASRPMGTLTTGAIETALSGFTSGLGSLAEAVTGSDPGSISSRMTYQPRTQIGGAMGALGGVAPKAIGKGYDKLFGMGPAAQTLKERIPQALGAVGTVTGISGALKGPVTEGLANYKPGFKRTPEAQRLIDQGVDLTPGQMNPSGAMNTFEQLPTRAHIPILGPLMADARGNALNTWQKSVAEAVAAPGTKIAATDINGMADEAYQSFAPLYDQAKGFPVSPVIMDVAANKTVPLKTAFAKSITDKSVQADPATRAQTGSWLMNKFGALQRKPGAGNLDSSQLLDLRSDIRAQIRKNARAKDAAKNDSAELLRGAEQAVTDVLESQLPPEALQTLRAADSKYAEYKVFEKAVAKAKDNPNGFSPENLAQAVKEATGESQYARGGGALRQQAKDAKAVLTNGMPSTGAIVPSSLAAAGLAIKYPFIAAPTALGATLLSATKGGRAFARGDTGIQRAAQGFAEQMSRKR